MTESAPKLRLAGPQWKFAIALYGQTGVSEACLFLQDRWRVDVSLLIAMLYAAGVLHHRIDAAAVQVADDAINVWRERVIAPLRTVRRDMKTMPTNEHPAAAELRETVKSAELKAEQVELMLLAELIEEMPAAERAPQSLPAVAAHVVGHFADAPVADAETIQAIGLIAEAAAAVAAMDLPS